VEKELCRLSEEDFRGVAVIEAALLIEAGYKNICDSLWYVHAPLAHRIRRMKEKRGYSDEKISNILAGQLSEEEFRASADVVIENPDGDRDGLMADLQQQIRVLLKDYVESTDKM
jgi:dephospho-CoA kinase